MATYTAANAIKKISTGDESGTWGDSTNNNFDIIDRAANGFVSIALSGTSFTLALSATASLSNGHYKAIKFTGSPGGTCTVLLEQSAKARIYMILNSTDQTLTITQRVSGTTTGTNISVDILTGKSAIILADGAGDSTAVVTDLTGVLGGFADLDVTAGTVSASKAVVVDANKDITGFRNVTLTGELDAATLDISADADIDGTLETDALSINSTAVTSTAAELNILDGVTSTTAELNILDGVTSTTAELNILDGVTATTAELNIMDGNTSATSITVADADRLVFNDNGTMMQIAASTLKAYASGLTFASVQTHSNTVSSSSFTTFNLGTLSSGQGALILPFVNESRLDSSPYTNATYTGLVNGGGFQLHSAGATISIQARNNGDAGSFSGVIIIFNGAE